jgi:lipopolysaccharide transport system permease protein
MMEYWDFCYIMLSIVQFGLYLSSVGFGSNIVQEQWQLVYSLNPAMRLIDGFCWAIFGKESTIYLPGFIPSLELVSLLFVIGLWYFHRMERIFADVI